MKTVELNPAPLSYSPPDPAATYRKRVLRMFRWLLVVGLLLLATDKLTSTEQQMWIDPITGSMSYKTVGCFGLTFNSKIDESPVDVRLKKMGRARAPQWDFLSSSGTSVLGGHWRACGIAPEVYQLRPLLTQYVDASSDAELLAFVNMMQSGTSTQKQEAVDAAGDKAVIYLANSTPLAANRK